MTTPKTAPQVGTDPGGNGWGASPEDTAHLRSLLGDEAVAAGDLERKLISVLAGDPEAIARVYDMGLKPDVFETPLNQYTYRFVIDYWLKSQKTKAPTVYAIETERPGFRGLPDVEEEPWWLAKELQKRYAANAVQEMTFQALKTYRQDPAGTLRRLTEDAKNAQDTAGAAPAHLRDRLMRLTDLRKLPPVCPLIDGLIYRDTLVQLSGAPGCYKSFLAVALSCSVALGRDLDTFKVPKAGTVVYVAAEGGNSMAVRVSAWCEANGVDPAEMEERLVILPLPIQLGDTTDVSQAIEVVAELGADLLVLDTRARCTLGLEENSATEQGKAIEDAEKIRAAAGCSVLVVHHTPRQGTAGRGSTAWDGAIWSDLRMSRKGDLHAVVHCEKHKDVSSGCDHHFALVRHTVSEELMPDATESQRQTLVLKSGEASGLLGLLMDSEKVVLEILRTTAPPEGLTAAQLLPMCAGFGVERTTLYAALKSLVEKGLATNLSPTKRPSRYVAGGSSD